MPSVPTEEDMKWGSPHFMYKGMMCAMASFKQHAAFGFWKGSLVVGPAAADMNSAGLVRTADADPGVRSGARDTCAGSAIYFPRSIKTMSEFSRVRSNTMALPSGVMSNVPRVPRLLSRVR
jgi:hypothetical protein